MYLSVIRFFVVGLCCLFVSNTSAQENVSDSSDSLSQEITVAAVGDIMLGNWVVDYLKTEGCDYPFRQIRNILQDSQLCIGNLEAPFATNGEAIEKAFVFRVHPRYAKALKLAGFDAVSLANNHIMDYGIMGLRQTLRTLDSLGIHCAGAGVNLQEAFSPARLSVGKNKIAYFAFSMTLPKEFWATEKTPGTAYPYLAVIQDSISKMHQQGFFVIVSFHWGKELQDTLRYYQQPMAHATIDAGADLVVGHHPHVLQGFEIYKNRLIAYSLGNLIFGSYSENARCSVILKVKLSRSHLCSAKIFPINVYNREVQFQPRILPAKQARKLFQHLNALSRPLNGGYDVFDENGNLKIGNQESVKF
ncbi:CapA family protein [bacterium]|nr:CapA family protein [bacterium]